MAMYWFIKRKDPYTTVCAYCKLAFICVQKNCVKIFNVVNISRTHRYIWLSDGTFVKNCPQAM